MRCAAHLGHGQKAMAELQFLVNMTHGRSDLSLATVSEISGPRALFPSEQWFYYWKTSANLWESQLAQYTGSYLNIPINWTFHSEDGETVDFGTHCPESNLARLAEIAESLGKEVLFFLAVTPLPIFPNGGVPSLLARSPAKDLTGINHAYIDLEGRISKFYSFFDQRIFQAFQKYTGQLGDHLAEHAVSASVVGLVGGAMEQEGERGYFINYSEDSSKAFDHGFSRFISKTSPHEMNFDSLEEEREAKYLYHLMIQELYLETAKESLGDYWQGSLDFAFLGGGPHDIFKRTCLSDEHPNDYIQRLTLSLIHNKIPSAVLLSDPSRTPGLIKFLSQVVTPTLIKSRLGPNRDEDEWEACYGPLRFFEIYQRPSQYSCHSQAWDCIGLKQYLDRVYAGAYIVTDQFNQLRKGNYSDEWVHGLFGSEMDEAILSDVLGAFLNGVCFILDTFGMAKQVERKLECFIMENSLEVEVVKYKTEIRRVTLGTGQILLFDSGPLSQQKQNVTNVFWERALSIFEFSYQDVELDGDVVVIWNKRLPQQDELNFTEIRRVILYNPNRVPSKVKIPPKKKFKLLRYVHEYNTTVKGLHGGVEVTMSGDGCVAIDFGLIE